MVLTHRVHGDQREQLTRALVMGKDRAKVLPKTLHALEGGRLAAWGVRQLPHDPRQGSVIGVHDQCPALEVPPKPQYRPVFERSGRFWQRFLPPNSVIELTGAKSVWTSAEPVSTATKSLRTGAKSVRTRAEPACTEFKSLGTYLSGYYRLLSPPRGQSQGPPVG